MSLGSDITGLIITGNIIELANNAIPTLIQIGFIVGVYVIFDFILHRLKKNLLSKARTKKQKSNIEIFAKVLHYSLAILILIFAIFSFTGSFQGFGITVGLLSAALGFALQKPITGFAAWIMVIIKRPFDIGDRIHIGEIKGDVIDITITHVYLKEIGKYGGEERSGRTIVLPNYLLFEKNIVNYSLQDDYVLGQVTISVTYESDMDEAIKIATKSAKKHTKDFLDIVKKEPHTRLKFNDSGVDLKLRFFAPFDRVQEISSNVTHELFNTFRESKLVDIAYPHMEVMYRKK